MTDLEGRSAPDAYGVPWWRRLLCFLRIHSTTPCPYTVPTEVQVERVLYGLPGWFNETVYACRFCDRIEP